MKILTWKLSQFWYDNETAEILAKELLHDTTAETVIAIISAQSVYAKIKVILSKSTKLKSETSMPDKENISIRIWFPIFTSRYYPRYFYKLRLQHTIAIPSYASWKSRSDTGWSTIFKWWMPYTNCNDCADTVEERYRKNNGVYRTENGGFGTEIVPKGKESGVWTKT